MRAGGRSWIAAGVCALAVAVPAASPAAPGEVGERFVPGEVIVGFEAGVGEDARASARRAVGAELEGRLLLPRTQLLDLDESESVRSAVEALERRDSVRYAEPNKIVHADVEPDDSFFSPEQWGLHNTGQVFHPAVPAGTPDADIDAPEAWDVQTGDGSSAGPVVAVVDGGVAYTHPELNDNIWENAAESGAQASDGLDNDLNGFIDDRRGWDFVANDPGDPDDSDGPTGPDGPDNDPMDLNGHGTHVAGTIGAEGNNASGVTGVAWDARIMPLRALGVSGSGTTAQIANAFVYAGDNGADVVNASLSGAGAAPMAITDAVTGAPNTLFVAAAGNLDSDNDTAPRFPCNVNAPNLICVAASNQDDELAGFSNFGETSVDLAAPGTNILSTYSRQVTGSSTPTRFFDDFETDITGRWDVTGAWDDTTTVPSAFDPPSLTDSPAGQYAVSTDTSARSPSIDLGGQSFCTLNYQAVLDIPASTNDSIRLETSPDGTTWTTVHQVNGTAGPLSLGADLGAIEGDSSIFFRYRLVSDASGVADGAYFDDVEVGCQSLNLRYQSGTSMATPMVSGVAALALSLDPTATVAQLRDAILGGVDGIASLDGDAATCGRLNAATALTIIEGSQTPTPVGEACPEEPVPPAPTPPVQPPPQGGGDNGAPDLNLSGKKKQKAGKKLTVKVACDEPCTVSGKGKLKAGGESAGLKAKPAELALGAGETGTLKLKLSGGARKAANQALEQDEKATVKVTVTATDAAGLTDRATRKIRLKG